MSRYPSKNTVVFSQLQKVFIFIYLFTVFSGAIRKWFIASKEIGNIILLIQLIIPFSFLLVKGGLQNWRFADKTFFGFCILLILDIFNPLGKSIYHGIIGLPLHAGFFFMVIFYLNNRERFKFEQVLPFLVTLSFLQIILSFIQYSQPDDSFINTYADLEAVAGSIAKVGQSVRVSGTFSYISGFTAYLLFHIFLVWALVKARYKSYATILLFFFGLIACFMSGSRGATYLYLLIGIYIFFVEFRDLRNLVFNRHLLFPGLLVALILAGTGNKAVQDSISQAFSNFDERRTGLQQSGEEQQRILTEFLSFVNFRGQHPITGVGLGATYQGAVRLFGVSPEVEAYGFYESEQERILLEGGYLLFFMRILMIIQIMILLRVPKLAKILLGLLLVFFIPTVFNIYNSVFAAIGIILVDYFYSIKHNISVSNLRTSIVKNERESQFGTS